MVLPLFGCGQHSGKENLMPFIDGRTIPEILMRPGIRGRFLAHKDLGASRVSLLMNTAEPGAAVPLHMHEVEETVVMFEGRIWVQLGEDRRVIGPDDTVIIPPHTPHAWGTEGSEAARMMWVYGGPDPFADSTYFEGKPPKERA
jgi:quercetin dioxygenase-like cupin family protein